VPLTCQRCLRPFRWPVEQTTLVLLARDERELARLDGEDPSTRSFSPRSRSTGRAVEDELLLTLPFVPRCPSRVARGRADAAVNEHPLTPTR